MEAPLDVYHKWLGIPPKDQPPHHYRLLGIDAFETDPDVIEHAADQRMHHVRSLASGKHSALSQQLLNEIAAARVCLLNPQQKAAYDGRLRGQLQPQDAPPEIVIGPPPVRPARAPARMWSIGVAGVLVVSIVLAVVFLRGSPQPPAEVAKPGDSSPPAPPPKPPEGAKPPTVTVPPATAPDPLKAIEAAAGMVTDKFALCQTMTLAEFSRVVEELRKLNYRPTRARPFVVEDTVHVAAIWTRDELPWKFAAGLTPEELASENERRASEGFVPVDVAAWQVRSNPPLCMGIWARTGAKPEDFAMYAAAAPQEKASKYEETTKRGFRPIARQHFLAADGEVYHTFLFHKHKRAYYTGYGGSAFYESRKQDDRIQIDGSLSLQIRKGNVEPLYAGVWETSTKRDSQERHGLPPAEHLAECRKLAAEGLRPVAIGVVAISADQPWITASVWH